MNIDKAIDYLEEHWPKGNNQRGDAMVLMGISQMAGREEMKIIMKNQEELCRE